MKSSKFIVALLLIASVASAQSELTLPFMYDVFQSSYINPSVTPEHKVSVGLPSCASVQLINTAFMFGDFTRAKSIDTMSINIEDFYNQLSNKNMLYLGQNLDLFHVRFKIQNAFYWFAVRENLDASLFFAKDLFGLLTEGTGAYKGSRMNFSDMKIKANARLEYSLGMQMNFNRWTFGARLSVLQGLANLNFDPDKLYLEIDEETFENHFVADAAFESSGLPFDGNGHLDPKYLKFTGNLGMGLSAGVTYKFNERISASFSFYDLGFIKWKQNLNTYKFQGEYTVKGLDNLQGFLENEGMKFDFDSLLNGLKDAFKIDTVPVPGQPYTTGLNPKFNLMGDFKLASRTHLYAMFHATINRKFYPTFTLGISQGLGRFFYLTANCSYAYRTLKNLGVGLVIKPGPVQIFVAMDNYFPLLSNDHLLSLTNVNARVGINLVFGRVSQPDGMPIW